MWIVIKKYIYVYKLLWFLLKRLLSTEYGLSFQLMPFCVYKSMLGNSENRLKDASEKKSFQIGYVMLCAFSSIWFKSISSSTTINWIHHAKLLRTCYQKRDARWWRTRRWRWRQKEMLCWFQHPVLFTYFLLYGIKRKTMMKYASSLKRKTFEIKALPNNGRTIYSHLL